MLSCESHLLSFGFHSYALARMSFYEIYRIYKFHEWLPQMCTDFVVTFQSRFVSLCPWRSHKVGFNDFNLGSSLYVLEGVIKWDSTISTSVCLFMSLKVIKWAKGYWRILEEEIRILLWNALSHFIIFFWEWQLSVKRTKF